MSDRLCTQCGTRLLYGARSQATLCASCFHREYLERAAEWQADMTTDPTERVKRAEEIAADLAAELGWTKEGDKA